MAEDGVTHSIVSFLERPVHFKTGKWSSSDVRGSALCKIDIPTDIVKLPMYKNKLNYLLGLRADFKIRVQVNSQPFQAGRLILSWVPFLKTGDKTGLQQRNVYYNALAEKNLTPISGCPRTEIDLSTTTEATMNIPYISPFSYYHLPTLAGDFGRFQLVVYSPLVDTVSSGVVDYSVWVSMHNVKAEFPTGVEIKSVAQIGDEATTENKQGIVESTFSKFSQSLKLFRDIPLLSNYIRPAIWTSDKVTDVAKIFGWSKPHSVSDISLVQQNTARYMANYDGIDMSTNMGFSASNEIEQTPGLFRTDVDEMSLAHILRTPNYYTRFEWTKTDLSDKLLFSTFINPLLYGFIIDDKKKLLAPTHLSYLARHFVLWRGGLNFTFKFVKTKFHSGRIRLAFIPGTFDKEVKVENLNFDANYSTVVDLRSQTEITFNVPFVSIVPWLQCQNLESTGPIITTTTGRLVMIVLNELVPASSVSDKIDVLVEVAAAEDFEFAIPVKPNLAPYSEPPKVKRSLVETLSTIAQVGVDTVVPVPFEDLQKQGTTGAVEVSNHKTHTDMMVCANTVGEKVTSVRQLIKRFYRAGKYKEDVKVAMLRIFPYSFYSPISDSTKADSWCEECTSLDTFAYLYAFFRGSIRYKIIQEKFTKPSYSYLLPASFSDEDLPRGVLGYADKEIPPGMHRSKGSQKIHFPQLDGLAELQIPYYSLYPFSVVGTTDKCNLATANNGYRSFNSLAYYPKDTTRLDVYTAAGDDFSFAFLLGAPWIIEGELPPQK